PLPHTPPPGRAGGRSRPPAAAAIDPGPRAHPLPRRVRPARRSPRRCRMNVDLERKLRHLRLSGFVQALPVRNQEAISNHLAYVEFLEPLVEDELERRRQLLFQRRLKQAQLPQVKSLDTFDWGFNPQIPKPLVLDLATCRFVAEHAGILILGPPGTGKSHIAIS